MDVLVFLFAVVSTALLVGILLSGPANRRCRIRCSCVDDSVALGALASVAEKAKVRDGQR